MEKWKTRIKIPIMQISTNPQITEVADLKALIIDAAVLLAEIANNPHYQKLLEDGYTPDLNIADAQTALDYLQGELS